MSDNRWSGFRSLPLQLFIFTVLPLTALLATIAFGSLWLHQQAMRGMVGERDERATRAAAAAMAEQLNHRMAAIRSVALQAASSAAGPEHAISDASYLQPDFEGGLALVTAAGEIVAASNGRDIWQARSIADRLRESPPSSPLNPVHFLPPFVDPIEDETLILVTATVGELTAVGGFFPASLARTILADLFSGQNQGAVTIVTTTGDVLYQIGSPPWAERPLHTQPGVADALRGESGTTYLTAGGEEYVVAFNSIPPVGWALVIAEPWRRVTDPLLRTTEWVPIFLVPILVIAMVALWFGVRQVVQPLQRLEQKATHLGWGDFSAIEESVGGINEIQRLQTELIHMARKVKQAQQSLRDYLGAVTTGQEEERRRLARELHDDTIQSLIALNQQIQLAEMAAEDDPIRKRLGNMQRMAEQIVVDLRRLTRALRPIYLEDLGLVPALEMLVDESSRTLNHLVHFEIEGQVSRLSPDVELALYRIAQEGLSNVSRHAQANLVEVRLSFAKEEVCLFIRDHGRGFVAPESPAEMAPAGHYGLLGINERAEAIGGQLRIQTAPGAGTELIICVPRAEQPFVKKG